jgi:flagellar biosynthesis protein FlhG
VLAGRSGGALLAEPAALERMRTLVTEATLAWRIVLVDLAAGLGPTERQLAVAAHTLLVVATEEPTSLTDAYAVLKLHRQDRGGGGDSRVVVNQASDAVAGDRTWRILDRACAGFLGEGVPLAGIVRRDPRVPEAIRRQTPLLTRHPGCPAAADIRALAEALLATTLPARAA